MNHELSDVPAGFRKGRGTRDQIANIRWIMEKAREFQKNIYFCFIDYAKVLTMWITINCGKFWKGWEYQTAWQQLELDMAPPTQWTWVWGSSGSWWWTRRPDVLQSMGSQRVGHDWATELKPWTNPCRLNPTTCKSYTWGPGGIYPRNTSHLNLKINKGIYQIDRIKKKKAHNHFNTHRKKPLTNPWSFHDNNTQQARKRREISQPDKGHLKENPQPMSHFTVKVWWLISL